MKYVRSGKNELAVYRHGERSASPPVLIVPGYGMNSSIFAFHPSWGGKGGKAPLSGRSPSGVSGEAARGRSPL